MAELNERQRRFCDEYLIDLNATQAAIRAGYSEKTAGVMAAENLKKPNIKEYISARMAEKEKGLIADQNEVLEYLTAVMRGKTQAEVIVVENTGDFSSRARAVQKAPDEKEKLKAAELLGKRYGLYSEKVDLSGSIPVVISGSDELED